jgi:hypothetical protein
VSLAPGKQISILFSLSQARWLLLHTDGRQAHASAAPPRQPNYQTFSGCTPVAWSRQMQECKHARGETAPSPSRGGGSARLSPRAAAGRVASGHDLSEARSRGAERAKRHGAATACLPRPVTPPAARAHMACAAPSQGERNWARSSPSAASSLPRASAARGAVPRCPQVRRGRANRARAGLEKRSPYYLARTLPS